MSFDNDMKPEGSTTNQWAAMGHTYSTTWESHHTARVSKVLKAGKHTIQMLFKGGASSYVNGAGLNGFYVKASADTSSKNCKYSSWAQTWSRNQVKTMCAIDLKANRNSIAYGTFTGHARHNSGASYGTIGFNNDVNSQAAAHNQIHAPCHSYSSQWEVYGGGRARVFPKADVKIESKLSCHASQCYLNGAGMSALVFPTEDTNKGCVRRMSAMLPLSGCAHGQRLSLPHRSKRLAVHTCAHLLSVWTPKIVAVLGNRGAGTRGSSHRRSSSKRNQVAGASASVSVWLTPPALLFFSWQAKWGADFLLPCQVPARVRAHLCREKWSKTRHTLCNSCAPFTLHGCVQAAALPVATCLASKSGSRGRQSCSLSSTASANPMRCNAACFAYLRAHLAACAWHVLG